MKRKLTLALAILLVIALFAGCGGGGTTKETSAPANGTQAPGATATPAEDDSPYNFAAGKYDVNEAGYPTAPYEYELPLSTTDEVISFWTVVWTPQYIPEEGYGSMPMTVEQQELTGVNIDYVVIPSESRAENYSVLLAADDLCDIMCGSTAFTSETPEKNIEDGYWVNLYEYKEYMPNYMYQATFDPADDTTYNTVFYKEGMIAAFYALEDVAFVGSNYMARADWLEDLGLSNETIITWDDVHNMLTLMKSNGYCEFPFPMFSSIDMAGNYAFNSYDTLPFINPYGVGPQYVVNGKVTFAHMNDNDKALMTRLNQWYSEGLIDPGWSGYDNNTLFTDKILNGEVGYVYMSPGEVAGYEQSAADPDCQWAPIHKPLLAVDQVVHVGGEKARPFYGSATVSPSCENIELAITWLDWKYSPSGSFIVSYGPEGVLWEKDENGKIVATEWAMNNPDGLAFAWACMLYGLNALAEPGMEATARKYIIPGGDRLYAMHFFWDEYNYDGAYKWPVGAKLTEEQITESNTYKADIVTYISENYAAFVDGSKPLAEWDSYVAGLRSLGIDRVIEIYQEAYDAYMARQAA